jgi:hypothetical protein
MTTAGCSSAPALHHLHDTTSPTSRGVEMHVVIRTASTARTSVCAARHHADGQQAVHEAPGRGLGAHTAGLHRRATAEHRVVRAAARALACWDGRRRRRRHRWYDAAPPHARTVSKCSTPRVERRVTRGSQQMESVALTWQVDDRSLSHGEEGHRWPTRLAFPLVQALKIALHWRMGTTVRQ